LAFVSLVSLLFEQGSNIWYKKAFKILRKRERERELARERGSEQVRERETMRGWERVVT